jgi:hypothetical protein
MSFRQSASVIGASCAFAQNETTDSNNKAGQQTRKEQTIFINTFSGCADLPRRNKRTLIKSISTIYQYSGAGKQRNLRQDRPAGIPSLKSS